MRYVRAKHKEEMQTFAYRIYISDAFYLQGQQMAHGDRWIDRVNAMEKPQTYDDRDGNEIAKDVIERLGLRMNTTNECI